MEELTIHEKIEKAYEEFAKKYADVINDLSTKYNVDVGVARDHLIAIARAKVLRLEEKYTTDIEYDENELIRDYAAILELSSQA